MFHSLNNDFLTKEGRRAHGLIKTPMDEFEKYEEEQALRAVEQDAKYNRGLFDRVAIKEMQLKNLNPLRTAASQQ
jgi:hypothetical protein